MISTFLSSGNQTATAALLRVLGATVETTLQQLPDVCLSIFIKI